MRRRRLRRVEAAGSDGNTEGHAIRVAVSHDECSLHVIVSDTGPGFEEPGRVFEPFYTTQQPGEGSGLGLNICYGIVREHGGEISAFNLHPRGAAVVVELPVGRAVRGEGVGEGPPRGCLLRKVFGGLGIGLDLWCRVWACRKAGLLGSCMGGGFVKVGGRGEDGIPQGLKPLFFGGGEAEG